jgi:hypothetical protein
MNPKTKVSNLEDFGRKQKRKQFGNFCRIKKRNDSALREIGIRVKIKPEK